MTPAPAVLRIHPIRFAAIFAPLWLLLGPSLWLYWNEWMERPILLTFVGGAPILAALIAAVFLRPRWYLEFLTDGLLHQTLGRSELFPWERVEVVDIRRHAFGLAGSIVVRCREDQGGLPGPRAPRGARPVLAIFGNWTARRLADEIEARAAKRRPG